MSLLPATFFFLPGILAQITKWLLACFHWGCSRIMKGPEHHTRSRPTSLGNIIMRHLSRLSAVASQWAPPSFLFFVRGKRQAKKKFLPHQQNTVCVKVFFFSPLYIWLCCCPLFVSLQGLIHSLPQPGTMHCRIHTFPGPLMVLSNLKPTCTRIKRRSMLCFASDLSFFRGNDRGWAKLKEQGNWFFFFLPFKQTQYNRSKYNSPSELT